MSPANEVEVVFVEELADHLGSEGETHAAVVLSPAHRVLMTSYFIHTLTQGAFASGGGGGGSMADRI